MKRVHGLCERCLRNGQIVPGVIVHHKKPLDADTVSDPNIALNFDNLELLCRKHHAEAHGKILKRYTVDAMGRVTARE